MQQPDLWTDFAVGLTSLEPVLNFHRRAWGENWRCVIPTESVQSQWIMSDVSASSPAVLYEVTWSLTSMGGMLPQKLNRDCRIWFHGVLWSATVRATERNQDVFHWQPCWCIYSWCFLLLPWFTALLLWCIFLCPHSPVSFSSPTLLRWWSGGVGRFVLHQLHSESLLQEMQGHMSFWEFNRVPTCCLPVQFG